MAARRSLGLLRRLHPSEPAGLHPWSSHTFSQVNDHLGSQAGASSATTDILHAGLPSLISRSIRTQKRKLEVVLCAYLQGLGRVGDVVRVSPGFARNLLIPYKLALPALDKHVKAVRETKEKFLLDSPDTEEQPGDAATEDAPKADVGVSAADRVSEAEDVARRLDAATLSIRRVTPWKSTQVRDPVGAQDVASEVLRQFGINLDVKNLVFGAPLQTVGVYEIPVKFPQDVTLPGGKEQVSLKVNLRRT